MHEVVWKTEPEEHDYPAAEAYLSLLLNDAQAHALATKLQTAPLVRGNLRTGTPLQIADGYHRVCASYHVDENTDIPCRIADA